MRDRLARIILGICAAGALMAAASMVASVADGEGPLQVAETWRLAGLPVFAGLFVILAVRPRGTAGLWELVIVNKLALVVAGATYLSGADGASEFVVVDGALVALLIVAYALTQGWTAWTTR
jgi:putative intracellular protease/amidase